MNLKSNGTSLALVVLAFAVEASGAELKQAKGEITLEDAAGDVQPMSSSSGEHPGRDVVKLRLASDGKDLTIAATLAGDMSGTFASDVIRLYVDKDNDAATGAGASWTKQTGFEWKVELLGCIEYENGASACVGGAGDKATAYYAVAKVTDNASGQSAKSVWELPKTPIQGKVVEAKVPYAELGVASGQTVRLYARESNGPYDESSYFPEVALTLK